MAQVRRNDLAIYDSAAASWWSDEVRWVRALKNLVPARLRHFDRFIDWHGKAVQDLGCAGGFMAEALDDPRRAGQRARPRGTGDRRGGRPCSADRPHHRLPEPASERPCPIRAAAFDAVVCVDVLEHVADLRQVLQEVARVLRPGGIFFFDTINRTAIARLFTITLAENFLRVLPKGTHDPALFIRPDALRNHMHEARLAPQPFTGLGPRFIDRRGDPTFGRIPLTSVLYMGQCDPKGRGLMTYLAPSRATRCLFGGMVSILSASRRFSSRALPADQAGPLLRRAFPHFYLFVIGRRRARRASARRRGSGLRADPWRDRRNHDPRAPIADAGDQCCDGFGGAKALSQAAHALRGDYHRAYPPCGLGALAHPARLGRCGSGSQPARPAHDGWAAPWETRPGQRSAQKRADYAAIGVVQRVDDVEMMPAGPPLHGGSPRPSPATLPDPGRRPLFRPTQTVTGQPGACCRTGLSAAASAASIRKSAFIEVFINGPRSETGEIGIICARRRATSTGTTVRRAHARHKVPARRMPDQPKRPGDLARGDGDRRGHLGRDVADPHPRAEVVGRPFAQAQPRARTPSARWEKVSRSNLRQ